MQHTMLLSEVTQVIQILSRINLGAARVEYVQGEFVVTLEEAAQGTIQ